MRLNQVCMKILQTGRKMRKHIEKKEKTHGLCEWIEPQRPSLNLSLHITSSRKPSLTSPGPTEVLLLCAPLKPCTGGDIPGL